MLTWLTLVDNFNDQEIVRTTNNGDVQPYTTRPSLSCSPGLGVIGMWKRSIQASCTRENRENGVLELPNMWLRMAEGHQGSKIQRCNAVKSYYR